MRLQTVLSGCGRCLSTHSSFGGTTLTFLLCLEVENTKKEGEGRTKNKAFRERSYLPRDLSVEGRQ